MSALAGHDSRWPSRWRVRAYIRTLRLAGKWTHTDGGKFRYWLWSLACRLKRTCPASSHSVIVWGYLRDPRIDEMCRQGCTETGACWCGKLRQERQP